MKRLKRIADVTVGDLVYYHQRGSYNPKFMKEGYTIVRDAEVGHAVKLAANDQKAVDRHKAIHEERGYTVNHTPTYLASPREVMIPNDKDLKAYLKEIQ